MTEKEYQQKSMKLLGRYALAIGSDDINEALDILIEIAEFSDSTPPEIARKNGADPSKGMGEFAEAWCDELRKQGHPAPMATLMRGLVEAVRSEFMKESVDK